MTTRTLTRRALGAGAALPALAAGCGFQRQDQPSARPAIAPGTHVRILGTNTDSIFAGTRSAAVGPILREWQQKTGIVVDNVEAGSGSYNDQLQVLIAADTAPEVIGVGGSTDPLGSLLLGGALRAVDPLLKRDRYDIADYYANSMDQYKVKGALWAMPMTSNPSAMFLNRDLFTRGGAALPPTGWKAASWTWNDFLATARSLTRGIPTGEPGASPEQTVFGAAVADNLKTPLLAVWSFGGDVFDKDLTRCTLDSPQALDALQLMADLVVKHKVNPSPADLKGTNVGNLFSDSRIALLAQGQQLGYARTLDANKPAFPWGVAVLPKGPGGRFALNIGSAYALTKGGKQPDAGWELLKFISSAEFSRPYMGDGLAAIAPRKSVMAEVLKSANLPAGYKEVVDYGDSLHRLPTIARWVEVSSAISKHFGRLWNGDVAVRQIVSDLSTEVRPLLEPRIQ